MAFNVFRQRELDVDDPRTTQLWKQIVKRKGFLNSIYEEWYSEIKAWLPTDGGAVLELGSGAGFLRERSLISSLRTSCTAQDYARSWTPTSCPFATARCAPWS
jgi:hypothetical protein